MKPCNGLDLPPVIHSSKHGSTSRESHIVPLDLRFCVRLSLQILATSRQVHAARSALDVVLHLVDSGR